MDMIINEATDEVVKLCNIAVVEETDDVSIM